jgi:hypothetical protein
MPARYIDDSLDPATVTAIMAAFDEACKALGLANRDDPLTDLLARKVVEMARQGERDPTRLRNLTLQSLGLN